MKVKQEEEVEEEVNNLLKVDVKLEVEVEVKKKRTRRYTYKCKEISSYKIFQTYVKYKYDLNSELKCDATEILSKDCYQKWLISRRNYPKKPEEAFRRALTAHVRGVDGRRPFLPEIEESLLCELRKKQQWKCFAGLTKCGSIGVQGFPSMGFHESQSKFKGCTLKKKLKITEKNKSLKLEPTDVLTDEMEMYEHINLLLEPDEVELYSHPLKKYKYKYKQEK